MANYWHIEIILKNENDYQKLKNFLDENFEENEKDKWNKYLSALKILKDENELEYYVFFSETEKWKYDFNNFYFYAKYQIPFIMLEKIFEKLQINDIEFLWNYKYWEEYIGTLNTDYSFNIKKRYFPELKEYIIRLSSFLQSKWLNNKKINKLIRQLNSWNFDWSLNKQTDMLLDDINNQLFLKTKIKTLRNEIWEYYKWKKIKNMSQNELKNCYKKYYKFPF